MVSVFHMLLTYSSHDFHTHTPSSDGNKLHCDQNEKLGMYGCTFYALSDSCSSRIVKLFSMPKKNAVIIYAYFRFVDTDL